MPDQGRACPPETGRLDIQNDAWLRQAVPADGRRPAGPEGGKILQARSGGDVIGALVGLSYSRRGLFLFSA